MSARPTCEDPRQVHTRIGMVTVVAAVADRVAELEAIVESIPETEDGVTIKLGGWVYCRLENGNVVGLEVVGLMVKPVVRIKLRSPQQSARLGFLETESMPTTHCYSTRSAAEAAAKEGAGT